MGGVSGPLPGAVFQVSGWCESPLPSLASSGPPPYLQFQSASLVIWGSVASGQGKVVHPVIPTELGLMLEPKKAWVLLQCQKILQLQIGNPCSLPGARGWGGGWGGGQGEGDRKQAYSQVICT